MCEKEPLSQGSFFAQNRANKIAQKQGINCEKCIFFIEKINKVKGNMIY